MRNYGPHLTKSLYDLDLLRCFNIEDGFWDLKSAEMPQMQKELIKYAKYGCKINSIKVTQRVKYNMEEI